MNSNYQNLYDGYLRANKEDVAKVAKNRFDKIVENIRRKTGDPDLAFKTAVVAFASFVVMDNFLSDQEWALFEYILQKHISREEVIQICKCAENGKGAQIIKNEMNVNPQFKEDVIGLGLCVCAIDGRISPDEDKLINYYIN